MPKKVLLITADQWRGDSLGVLGHPTSITPNIDRLAREGVTFLRHYTASAPCGPARTTLLTGLYPFIHRAVRNGSPLDQRHTNIALETRKLGYDPVLFGYTDSSADPRTMAPADPRLKSYEGVIPGFRLEASLNEYCLTGWLSELARKGYEIPEQMIDIYLHPDTPRVMESFSRAPARYSANDSDTAYIADKVLDYLRLRRKDDWFVHAVFLRPHPPLIAPSPYNTLIDAAKVPPAVKLPDQAEEMAVHPYHSYWLTDQQKPAYFESQVNVQALPESNLADMRAVYYGLLNEVDVQVGRILDHLRLTGEMDETLVIFTSDHGELLGDHWAWGKGGWYDNSNFIPLVIRDPNTPVSSRGTTVDEFTESVDLFPTMLEWLGAPVPEEANGFSLLPWLRGATPEQWRDYIFWEFDFRTPDGLQAETRLGLTPDQCTLNVIRDRDYKYVHFTAMPPLLFDLKRDASELENIVDAKGSGPIIARYAQKLLSHRMLHAERTLTNAMLSPKGVVRFSGPRGLPAGTGRAPRPAVALT